MSVHVYIYIYIYIPVSLPPLKASVPVLTTLSFTYIHSFLNHCSLSYSWLHPLCLSSHCSSLLIETEREEEGGSRMCHNLLLQLFLFIKTQTCKQRSMESLQTAQK
ncbi:hypothetical protein GDO81_000136 [Engystomops pustulosus]|uniref:Uncharacterized protein n=1 Tax=Engystomops pustulosus TaxID=76066 RepID=A0AAV7D2E1_ENGPU|nr:hypothetical protein GDO81_000136 [Engystomops pustulosus]